MNRDNPLSTKRFAIPFAEVRASDVKPAVDAALETARARQDSLIATEGERTYENTVLALEDVTEHLDYVMHVVSHLEAVATSPELRAAYNEILPRVSTFTTQLALSGELWAAVNSVAESDAGKSLSGLKRRLLDRTVRDLRRAGAALAADEKARIEEINRELVQLTTEFSESVLDDTAEFEMIVTDPERLSGLPPSIVDATRADAESRGLEGWRFTLHEPIFFPVLTYADDRELRRALYHAHTTRATHGKRDNRPRILRILELRREKAKIVGYEDFADYVLDERMAKKGEVARKFIAELEERTRPFFEKENQELNEFRRDQGEETELEPWDLSYWAERLRKERYDFDDEQLRPYFPMDSVLRGLFQIAERLFRIRIVEIKPHEDGFPGVWHADARYFRIVDEASSRHLGSFYSDMHPRDTKRGGAWMSPLITGKPKGEGLEAHLGSICGNLSRPVGDRPSLLTHREVETIFHEFGHLLHHCLTEVEVPSLAGTNVAWDFVELPSQIMENWCWERSALDLFARHFETDEPIPSDLFEKMYRARNFRSANAMMRQLGFASLDLALHTRYDPAGDGDLLDYVRAIQNRFSPVALPDDYAMVAAFTHLFGDPTGYAAGYYSYKWAEVLDADAFTRFSGEGALNRETGTSFRKAILSTGDSEDPSVLFRRFLGRDPSPEALLERSGLVRER